MKWKTNLMMILIGCSIISCKKDASDIVKLRDATFIIYTYDEYGSPSGSGSGFIIDPDGIGITNYHVLNGATKAIIMFPDSAIFEIERVLTSDENKDIARFKIKKNEETKFKTLNISTREPKQGDKIFCISNPLGYENSFSEGIISALRSDKKHGSTIQFTAPISPGSSGGAVIDETGKVIAIATFQTRSGQNINFGISLTEAVINSVNKDDFANKNPKFSKGEQFLILNQKADNDPFSVLNAIEFDDSFTTLYFTYTRLGLSPDIDNQWGFWFEIDKGNEGFYLEDLDSKKKYYIKSSDIGDNPETMTKVPLATTIQYKVIIQKVPASIQRFAIFEKNDSRAAVWNEIDLSSYESLESFTNSTYLLAYSLATLKEEDGFDDAIGLFLEILNNDPENVEALNALGVVSFAINNYNDALGYLSKAIEINPTVEESYVNRHFVHLALDEMELALSDITNAILISPQEPDYYLYREKLHLYFEDKESAMNDFYAAYEILAKDRNKSLIFEGLSKMSVYDYFLKTRFEE